MFGEGKGECKTMWFYVFLLPDGSVSIETELNGRKCAFQSNRYAESEAWAERLKERLAEKAHIALCIKYNLYQNAPA